MKIFYVKTFCKTLSILLFIAVFQNARAGNRVGSMKKLRLGNAGFSITDTTKHISKKKDNDEAIDKDKNIGTAIDKDKKQPEDGVDDDIKARYEQEFERTKDLTLNRVPVERLIQAKSIKDQLISRRANLIKNQNNPGGVNQPVNPPPATISNVQWNERGPNNVGGRTRALLFDLNDAAHGYKKVFAGGVGGGLWYTDDISATPVSWNKINDFFENIAISCIAQNPVNPLEIYAGTGEGWGNIDAVRGLGVWKSADGGATWAQLTGTLSFLFVNSILVDKNGSVYVAGNGYGVQKSSDGGATWHQVIASPAYGADLQLAANGDIYASTGADGIGNIFISDFAVNGANTGNAGTWTNITPDGSGAITPATTSWWRIKLACAPGNANLVYALFEKANFLSLGSVQQYNKATNTWAVKAIPPGTSFSNSQAWYSIAAAVDPNNANILFAGSLDAVKSTDGGSTWTAMTEWTAGEISGLGSSQFVHADHHAYVFAPGSSSRLMMGTDGGIFYTANANASGGALPAFIMQDNGYNVTQFYSVALHPTNLNYALAGAQDNGTQQFSAAGVNATVQATGGDGGDAFIDQLNGDIQITSYVYNNHWVSIDGGANFTQHFSFSNSGSFINPSDYDPNQKNLYSGYGGGAYFRWDNVTTSNTSVVSVSGFAGAIITSVTVSPITANRVYFGLRNGTVVRVDNANAGLNNTGVILSPNPSVSASVSCIAIDPHSEDHLLVSYFNYGVVSIFETKNATAATPVWTSVEGNLPDMPVRWVMFYPGDVTKAIIATELGVWTTDALNSSSTVWNPSNSGFANVEVDMLTFRPSDRTLAAATHGRGLFTTTLPFEAPPVISYSSAQTYTTGIAIMPLVPLSNEVAFPAYSSSAVTLGSGLSGPFGVALDAAGDVYVADYNNNAVKKIPPGGGTPVSIGQAFSAPWGVAVDAAGNIYVANTGTGNVVKVPAGGGPQIILASGFIAPAGLAVDAAGNVYVGDIGNNQVEKIPAGGGTPVILGSGFNGPFGLAVDVSGNVYVADHGNNAVKEIPVAGGAPVSLGSGFSGPYGVAVDAAGNVYVADFNNYAVKEIPVGGGATVNLGSGFGHTAGIAADGAGNVYFADQTNNLVNEIKPIGGYYISPFLPAGLTFNNSTGIIGGTPTKASPATNYKVIGYNPLGASSSTFSITVIVPLPTISYSSPQTYIVGAAITALTPTSSSVAAAGYSGSPVILGSGFSSPTSAAVDAGGGIYVADEGHKLVKKIPVGGGAPVSLGSGFVTPYGVAVDAAGNVYAADYGNNSIKEIPVGGGTLVTLGSGFLTPTDVAVDAAGNVFVADYGNGAVKEILRTSGATITLGSGFSHPAGVAVDGLGNVYVADAGNNTVKKIPVGGGATVTLGSGFVTPHGVAVDGTGNLFVADYGNNAVKEIPVGGGAPIIIGAGFSHPVGIAVDAANNIYVADLSNNAVKEIKPVGGYYISNNLPAGLSFANAMGIISGTPTSVSPQTSYTITAYNTTGARAAAVLITVNSGLPAISYASPQTYTTGTAITALAPTASGVAAAGYSGAPVTLGSGFSSPTSVATDAAGNVYVTDEGHKAVKKIPVSGGAPVSLGSGFVTPYGVAADAAGNVYVADYGNNSVKEIPVGGGAMVTLGSGFLTPTDVAVDAAGNVYVADYGNGAVKKIPVGGGAPVILGSGFSHPAGVAVDGLGNVYLADAGNNTVKKIPVGGGAPVILGAGFITPHGVAIDGTGNVFVADYGNNAIKEIPVGGGAPVILGAGFSYPIGIAADAANNLYVADLSNNAVKEIKPVGGYYVSPTLPAGLSFYNAAGTISGIPTTASPATNYTITAYNSYGNKGATLSITINAPPALTISYISPQTYAIGTAIIPLAPTSSGVAAAGFSGSPVILGSGFSNPTGVAADAAGNVYVADEGHKLVKKIPAGGGAPIILGTGFVTPYGIAVDTAGNVYVADYGNNSINEIPIGGGAQLTLGSGFLTPTDVAVDAAGNVFVADYGNGAVKKIPVGGGAPVTLGSGFSHPSGVAVDGLGNVYLADAGNNTVKKVPVGGGAPVNLGSGFITPRGVAVDGSGNVFVGDYGNSAIKEIPVGGGAPVTLGTAFSHPIGIAVDASDNIYVADLSNNAVKQIKPVGGYYISLTLPPGLNFVNSTGIISGTPTAASSATNYTVTTYNSFGSKPATLNITVNASPAVAISYNSPQTYTTGTAISPLAPTSSGVAAAGFSSPIVLGSGFSSPTGAAADAAGNLYVADYGHKLVKKIPVGGTPVTIGSGFISPYGVAADAAGNVYVADYGNNSVTEILVGGGQVTLGSGFLTPTGVAVDVAGNVYVADFGNNAIKKIPVGGGAPVSIGSGFSHPAGVAVDGLGNVFVADNGNNAVKEIPAEGGAPVTVGSGFITPRGVAVDGTGNLFVADYGNSAVKEIPVGGGAPVTLGTGFSHPIGIAVDAADNIYVADLSNNAVKQIKPGGGYYINTTLPAGLSFSNATGVISGTPTESSPATNYTVTAYNTFGSTAALLNIKINSHNAGLANLVLSSGTLTPVFTTGTTSFTATVTNVTTSVTVTPTASDDGATLKVNGTAVLSGTASGSLALAVGPNVITTVVTAQDGTTTDTYTITVTRNMPGNNSLVEPISVNKIASPEFADGIVVHRGVSPNGDGINDVFTIDGLSGYPDNKVTIMNRDGAVIYEAKGYDNSSKVFDGHSNINGAMQLPGTYFYLLDYNVKGVVKHQTGFIILKW